MLDNALGRLGRGSTDQLREDVPECNAAQPGKRLSWVSFLNINALLKHIEKVTDWRNDWEGVRLKKWLGRCQIEEMIYVHSPPSLLIQYCPIFSFLVFFSKCLLVYLFLWYLHFIFIRMDVIHHLRHTFMAGKVKFKYYLAEIKTTVLQNIDCRIRDGNEKLTCH